MEKIFTFSNPKELVLFLKNADFPAFLSKITASDDLMKIAFFLLIVSSALQKLPELFIAFLREGIIGFLEKLALDEDLTNLQIYPLFKPPVNKFNPIAANGFDFKNYKYSHTAGPMMNQFDLNKELPILDKPIGIAQPGGMEEEEDFYEDKQIFDPNQILQNIQKDSKETEETLKEIEQEITKQTHEKNKYLELFQKFKKTKEKIQQTADLIQKSHKNPESGSILMPEKKDLTKPLGTLTENEQTQIKMKQIKSELHQLANNILALLKTSKEYKELDLSSTSEIMSCLNEIISLFKNNMNKLNNNDDDFGLKGFQVFLNVLDKYKRLTLYELKNSSIIKSLLEFIMDGSLKKLKIDPKKGDELFEEEVKMNPETNEEDISLSHHQISLIVKRMLLFLYVFQRSSPLNPQGFLLNNLILFLKNS